MIVEQTLRALYRLQQVDLELDELEAGSGDLPTEITELELDLQTVETTITTIESKLVDLRTRRTDGTAELQELRARSLELNERLRTVRNNKEYDATTTDIESADQRTNDVTSALAGLDNEEAELVREHQTQTKRKEELSEILEDKRETLETIHSSNSDEIDDLRRQKEEVLKELPEDLLTRYIHVRAKYPDAVVKTRKGACSGCYRAITPQTLVEMRRNETLFLCEHCNRILIDEELAETIETA